MIETIAVNHPPGMRSRRFAQTFVHAQRRRASEFAALVCRGQKFVLGGGVLSSRGHGRRGRLGGGRLTMDVVVPSVRCWRSCFCRARARNDGQHREGNSQGPEHNCWWNVSARGVPIKFRFPSLTLTSRIQLSDLRWRPYCWLPCSSEPLSCLGSRPFCCAAFRLPRKWM